MEVLAALSPILALLKPCKLIHLPEFLKTSCCKSVYIDWDDIYSKVKLRAEFQFLKKLFAK